MMHTSTWEDQRELKCIFPVIYSVPSVEIERVHPLQQESVCRIYRELHGDPRVVAVVLFGSSVNLRCTLRSDLDLAVRLNEEFVNRETKNEISERIQEACNWNADILWYDRIREGSRIYCNILKGVQIV